LVKVFRSPAELRTHAASWDDLYERSEVALPTARAELVALWCEHFARRQHLSAIVVEHQGQLVAALPLIERRWIGRKIGTLPGNQWSPAGDLLVDPACDVEAVLCQLVHHLARSGWPLVWFPAVPGATAPWGAFQSALEGQHVPWAGQERLRINQVALGANWSSYFASRSRNHRRHIRRITARALRQGSTLLVCHDRLAPQDVEPLLKTCFEIEASGWKGRAHGAVLHLPEVLNFYLEQARQLAAHEQLNVVLLQYADRPIAFEYGWVGKGTYFSPKVGYDERFASFAPGQLLRSLLFERLIEERAIDTVDFLGPASPATSAWATSDYPIHRLVAGFGATGRVAVEFFRRAWPLAHRVRAMRGRQGSPADRQPRAVAMVEDHADATADV
ncbi:MAG TPA: GNAT family N-acetyltransferase, partial [Pirellulales bacterium]|nr:GNAT family N-acetyltransferase [Pirellulales bacterium]